MANNVLEMKKQKMQHNPHKEGEDFNRFLWKYLSYIFVFVFGIGMGLWVVDAVACGDEAFEDEKIDINVRGI